MNQDLQLKLEYIDQLNQNLEKQLEESKILQIDKNTLQEKLNESISEIDTSVSILNDVQDKYNTTQREYEEFKSQQLRDYNDLK